MKYITTSKIDYIIEFSKRYNIYFRLLIDNKEIIKGLLDSKYNNIHEDFLNMNKDGHYAVDIYNGNPELIHCYSYNYGDRNLPLKVIG